MNAHAHNLAVIETLSGSLNRCLDYVCISYDPNATSLRIVFETSLDISE